MDRTQSEEQVRACLGAFGFGAEFVDRPVRVLSGGQRNRLGLLEADAHAPQLPRPRRADEPPRLGLGRGAGRSAAATSRARCSWCRTTGNCLSRAVNTLVVVAGGHSRLFHGGYEEYVQSLGGAPIWSEIAAFETERAAKRQMSRSRSAT